MTLLFLYHFFKLCIRYAHDGQVLTPETWSILDFFFVLCPIGDSWIS